MHAKQQLQTIVVLAMFSLFSSVRGDSTPAPEPSTGIEGVITISPTHGGPIREDEPGSAGLANTEFEARDEKGAVASFTTDDQGRFRVSLPPGHYSVSRKGVQRKIGRFGPFEVDVLAGKMSKVQWNCDSGMR